MTFAAIASAVSIAFMDVGVGGSERKLKGTENDGRTDGLDDAFVRELKERSAERIVNGISAEAADYRYFVRNIVRVPGGGAAYNCGGALISEQFVLTAAHCVTDESGVMDTSQLFGVAVGYLCDELHNCGRRSKFVAGRNWYVHPEYDANNLLYDFALIKLKERVTLYQPVLPDDGFVYDDLIAGDPLVSIGAGQVNNTEGSRPESGRLQAVGVAFWPEPRCSRSWATIIDQSFLPFGESVVCSFQANGPGGVCFGDSGSPLIRRKAGPSKEDVVVGVHSFVQGTLCENKFAPDVHARVSTGMTWIVSIVCEETTLGNRPYWCTGPVSTDAMEPLLSSGGESEESKCDETSETTFLLDPNDEGSRNRCSWLLEGDGRLLPYCNSQASTIPKTCCKTCEGFVVTTGMSLMAYPSVVPERPFP